MSGLNRDSVGLGGVWYGVWCGVWRVVWCVVWCMVWGMVCGMVCSMVYGVWYGVWYGVCVYLLRLGGGGEVRVCGVCRVLHSPG